MAKKEKYLYINNIQNLDLDYIKKSNAFLIIKNNNINKNEVFNKFIRKCKNMNINIYISNDVKLLFKLKLRHFYISAFNKSNYHHIKKINPKITIIGSAHNLKEIIEKKNQGCEKIILSRLFKTYKKGSHGIIKFNLITNQSKNDYIALGGITQKNHKKTNLINIKGYALSSALKFKPRFLID